MNTSVIGQREHALLPGIIVTEPSKPMDSLTIDRKTHGFLDRE